MPLLVADRRQVVDRRMQPISVEPLDPTGGRGLDLSRPCPGQLAPVDELGFVQPNGRFHERIIEGIPNRSNRRRNAGLDQSRRKRNRRLLRPRIRVMHQTRCGEAGISTPPREQSLLHRRHHQRGRLRSRNSPPQNTPRIDINHKRDVKEPDVRPDIRVMSSFP